MTCNSQSPVTHSETQGCSFSWFSCSCSTDGCLSLLYSFLHNDSTPDSISTQNLDERLDFKSIKFSFKDSLQVRCHAEFCLPHNFLVQR